MTPSMNLVPLAFQRKLLIRRRMRQWFIPCAIALIASLSACAEVGYRLSVLSRQSAALESQLGPMKAMSKENDQISARLSNLIGHESVLHEVVGVQRPLTLLAMISQSAERTNGRLQVKRLTVQQTAVDKPDPKVKTARPASVTEITLSGVALDDAAVATFVQALKDSSIFTTVELKSTVGVMLSDTSARQYDVTCRR
jgi:Tfp pilus assembly protein PilN